MAEITAATVKELRERTGVGMMDCKKALEESEGDFDRAVELLRVKGAKDVGKREARTASNGLVALKQDGDSAAALLELNCETDFVAKGERFQALAGQVVEAAKGSNDLSSITVEGKPLKDVLDDAGATLGEKIEVRRVATFEGAYVGSYLHRTNPDLPAQIGVLVATSSDAGDIGKDVAMHAAAMSPIFLNRDEVPAETVESERRIAEQTAREEGKPEQALPKIVEGRVNSFFKDFVLLEQPSVTDSKKTVAQVLKEAGIEVTRFVRFEVGQE